MPGVLFILVIPDSSRILWQEWGGSLLSVESPGKFQPVAGSQ